MKRYILSTIAAAGALLPAATAAQDATQAAEAAEQQAPDQHIMPFEDKLEVVDEAPAKTAEPADKTPVWQVEDVEQLLSAIDNVHAEGLTPADYDAAGLRALMTSGDHVQMSLAATERFERLAADLALGHVRGDARVDWHIEDPDLEPAGQLRYLLVRGLYDGNIGEVLDNLAPTHPQYAALKNALAQEIAKGGGADAEKIADIRLNLDRWRWLPRDLGDRYIIVNVPAYTAALVEDGETISRHRAVAGAVRTPTPQLMAEATGVIFNPYWNVPKSIEPEVRGKAGYEAIKADDGSIIRYRQPPGPSNALGRVKFVMYNPHLIYLHDTNARGLFDTTARAYSHGCIRTENILKLATILLEEDGGEWSAEKTAEVVNSGENTGAKFVKPLPVYVVYFSAVAKADGEILAYKDIYSRDTPVIAALNDTPQGVDPLAPIDDEMAALD